MSILLTLFVASSSKLFYISSLNFKPVLIAGCSMALLNEKKIAAKLASVKGWKQKNNEIYRTFTFKDFVRAMGFVQSVAIIAEKEDHHPDIDIRWNKVTLVLSTHSEGGITEKDFSLAVLINSLI